MAQDTDRKVYEALRDLDGWIVRSDWKAYDPFDGLNSPISGLLTLGMPRLKQVWAQSVRRFPVNLRPLLGIRKTTSTKAMGFFAQGYLKLYQTHGKKDDLEKMRFCLQWLSDHPSPGYKG